MHLETNKEQQSAETRAYRVACDCTTFCTTLVSSFKELTAAGARVLRVSAIDLSVATSSATSAHACSELRSLHSAQQLDLLVEVYERR
ncbi:unnamed protein product [Caenorhabditis sp. 36 PRJEB53466]|nr:unnamed protein product [Caenorhabditis sp. 36 PRJEB53466]